MRTRLLACLAAGIATAIVACSERPRPPTGPTPPPPALRGPQTATLIAVGDIGECGSEAVAQTAHLAEAIDGRVVLAGDIAYYEGTMRNFLECFEPAWGSNRRRWHPVPGNHEYETPFAAGYFQYFGEAAGRGFYSTRVGEWLVLMLNSNQSYVDMRSGSEQYEFVRAELLSNRTQCAMAVWHHPLFSSGPNGSHAFARDIYRLLHQQGVDVVVAAHDHLYERFGKQDADGVSDGGAIRQFIVGTGGARLYDFLRTVPNSQVRIKSHGVLRFSLHPSTYEWAFLDVNGGVGDAGADSCH